VTAGRTLATRAGRHGPDDFPGQRFTTTVRARGKKLKSVAEAVV
jgi:hypothetical protein